MQKQDCEVTMKFLILLSLCFNLYAQNADFDDDDLEIDDVPGVDRYGEKGPGDLTQALEDDKNVIIKYKSEEYFDFDALQVQGEIITPADLSTRSNKRVRFNIKDHIRKNFDDFIREDLIDIH